MSTMETFGFVDEETTNMYDWMRLIVERNLPFCEVENPLMRELVKMRPVSVAALKTSMQQVAKTIGNGIGADMGESFGVMFDGWSSGTSHFVATFAVFRIGKERHERLSALSQKEDGLTADAHIQYLDAVLAVYGKIL